MRCTLLRAEDPAWMDVLRAAPHDFYHLPTYVAFCAAQEGAEARALYVEDRRGRMLLPLLFRPLADGRTDAASPYGYPGPIVIGDQPEKLLGDALAAALPVLAHEGTVSLFVRFHPLLAAIPPSRIGTVVRHGQTVSVDLTLPPDTLWRQTRHGHRTEITRAIREGHRVTVDTAWRHLDAFKRLYRATMRRVHASPSYFFDDAYFDGLREALGDGLSLIVTEIAGDIAAAALFVETDGIVQYHLTGVDDRYASPHPTKGLIHFAMGWARERGARTLHLGGGVGGKEDSLLWFKAGFSPRRHAFHTLRVIVDGPAYRQLVFQRGEGWDPHAMDGFFPLYRQDAAPP